MSKNYADNIYASVVEEIIRELLIRCDSIRKMEHTTDQRIKTAKCEEGDDTKYIATLHANMHSIASLSLILSSVSTNKADGLLDIVPDADKDKVLEESLTIQNELADQASRNMNQVIDQEGA